jgi:hypothetical protein
LFYACSIKLAVGTGRPGVSTTEGRSPLFGSDVGSPITALVMLSLLRDSVLTTLGDIGGSAIVAREDLQVAKRPVLPAIQPPDE